MYLGTFGREVDGKGRIIVPAKLKETLEESGGGRRSELILTVGFERCLSLFPKRQWADFVKREIDSRSSLSRDTRALKRILAGNAQSVEIDRQGRLLIPKTFLDGHLQLSPRARRVVVVGTMDHIEIWREDSWAAFSKDMRQDFDEIAEKISRSGGAVA